MGRTALGFRPGLPAGVRPAIVVAGEGPMLHVFAAALALSDPSGPVVDARIPDILANPEHYGGQTLRIRGQIDACYSWVCSICPEEMRPETADSERCLRISFDDFPGGPDWDGGDGSFDRGVSREMEEAFRFSVVTAEGLFEPQCLTHRPWPPEPPRPVPEGETMIDEVVCMDRASTWRGVQVRAVHRRLTSNEGLVLDQRRDGVLTLAPPAIAALADAAWRRYLVTFDDSPDWKPVAVFRTESLNFDDPNREAWACVCRVDDCSGAWPRREISLWARTVNDPYFCYFALERQGVWRIYPE